MDIEKKMLRDDGQCKPHNEVIQVSYEKRKDMAPQALLTQFNGIFLTPFSSPKLSLIETLSMYMQLKS